MSLKVELGSDEFWAKLAADPKRLGAEICLIDTSNLDMELQKHAALRAWVNAAHEGARAAEEKSQWEVTKARARALLQSKEALDQHSGKTKTGVVLEAEVEVDAEVLTTTKALLAAQESRGALRAISGALEDRLQMLIQISAKQRQEMRDYQ